MSAIHTINRRTFLSTGASLVATGASFMMLPVYAASGPEPQPPLMQGGHHADAMDKCIDLCQDCYALCTKTVGHCLQLGGRHVAPEHIRLFLDCAQICDITAQYLLRGSSLHERMCGLCAEVCRQCADSCVQVAGDDQMVKQCADMCRTCAGSCERMASKVAA
jgi:hypothetical protein